MDSNNYPFFYINKIYEFKNGVINIEKMYIFLM